MYMSETRVRLSFPDGVQTSFPQMAPGIRQEQWSFTESKEVSRLLGSQAEAGSNFKVPITIPPRTGDL